MNYFDTGDYFIMLALAEGSKHGGAVSDQMIADSVGAVYLKSSSLYDALKRLEKAELIERSANPEMKAQAKSYRLTDHGQRQLASAVHMHERAVVLGRGRLGWRY